jgi:hypothetical protein
MSEFVLDILRIGGAGLLLVAAVFIMDFAGHIRGGKDE